MEYAEIRKLLSDKEKLHRLELETKFLDDTYGKKISIRQRLWHLDNQHHTILMCKICGEKPVQWCVTQYRRYCGSKCAQQDPATRVKTETTCMQRYGAKTNLSTEETKAKYRESCLEKYGVDNFAKSMEFKEKYSKTCVEKYGVTNTSMLDWVKDKIDQTHQQRYGRKRSSQRHIPAEAITLKDDVELMKHWFNDLKMPVTEIAERLGVNHSQLCLHFKNNLGIDITRHSVSRVEREIRNYVSNLVQCEFSNRKIIKPKELDIFVPSKNLAIEVDGLAWHCETRGKPRLYHATKHQQCESLGIHLIQILDLEWIEKQTIVQSRIRSLLGMNTKIGARQCKIVILTSDQAHEFFEKNHIQGKCIQKMAYGLQYGNTLVAAMSFGKPRFNKNFSWELLRFANLVGHTVVGGAQKLFSHFIKLHQPENVISYCDLRWNRGTVYSKLGFNLLRNTGPNYWYTKKYKTLESRVKYQKHKLSELLYDFDPNSTEWDNMVSHGYDRYWDCGNGVWVWHTQ